MTDEPTTTTAPPQQDGPSSGAEADHLADLIGDALPTASEPSEPSEPTAPAKSAEPAATTPTEPSAPASPEPPASKFKYQGREYTADELLKSPDLLTAIITSAEQFPHLQKKYLETLEQRQPQPPQPQTPAQAQPSPAQFRAALRTRYDPEVQELVKNDLIEADAAELYPNLIAQGLYLRDQILGVAQQLGIVSDQVNGFTGKASAKDTMTKVHADLDLLATEGSIYEGLKDAEKRGKFLDYIANELNPTVDRVTPDFLRRMWLAHNGEALVTVARQAGEAQRKADQAIRARAAGDGRGARPMASVPQPVSHLDSLIPEGTLPRR